MTHIPAERMSEYVDGVLPPDQMTLVETHLAECLECRTEVTEVSRLLSMRRGPRRRRTILGLSAIAGAALVILVATTVFNESSPQLSPERAGPAVEQLRTVRIASPALERVGDRWTARLRWESEGPDLTYRVTLTDGSGQSLWTTQTTDTAVEIPEAVDLRSGGVYFWIIDVTLPSGEAATSGVQQLQVP